MAHHGDEGKQSLLLLWKLLAENCVQLFNSWAVAPEKLWSSQLEGGSEAVVLDGEALQQLVGVALNVNTFGNFESLETILLATMAASLLLNSWPLPVTVVAMNFKTSSS